VHVSFEARIWDYSPKVVLLGRRVRVRLIGSFYHVTHVVIRGVCQDTDLMDSYWFFEFIPDFVGVIPFHVAAGCNDQPLFSSSDRRC